MNNLNKKIILIAGILAVITAIVTCIYLAGRDRVKAGDILIKTGSGDITVSLGDLSPSEFSGETVNKKGETKKIEAEGYPVADVVSLAGLSDYSEISVFSDDEYHATLTREEMSDPEKAWLYKDEDGLRLVVFGDNDSKRNVKNVVRIEVK